MFSACLTVGLSHLSAIWDRACQICLLARSVSVATVGRGVEKQVMVGIGHALFLPFSSLLSAQLNLRLAGRFHSWATWGSAHRAYLCLLGRLTVSRRPCAPNIPLSLLVHLKAQNEASHTQPQMSPSKYPGVHLVAVAHWLRAEKERAGRDWGAERWPFIAGSWSATWCVRISR